MPCPCPMPLATLVVALLAVGACRAPAPTPPDERSSPPADYGLRMDAEADALHQTLRRRGLILRDPAVIADVGSVVSRLTAAAPAERPAIKPFVLKSPMVNAMALPNGELDAPTSASTAWGFSSNSSAEWLQYFSEKYFQIIQRFLGLFRMTYLQNNSILTFDRL